MNTYFRISVVIQLLGFKKLFDSASYLIELFQRGSSQIDPIVVAQNRISIFWAISNAALGFLFTKFAWDIGSYIEVHGRSAKVESFHNQETVSLFYFGIRSLGILAGDMALRNLLDAIRSSVGENSYSGLSVGAEYLLPWILLPSVASAIALFVPGSLCVLLRRSK